MHKYFSVTNPKFPYKLKIQNSLELSLTFSPSFFYNDHITSKNQLLSSLSVDMVQKTPLSSNKKMMNNTEFLLTKYFRTLFVTQYKQVVQQRNV